MEWCKGKMGQVIALVSIVGTLAGFGYTGATYVNRIENPEKKIGGLGETEDAQQAIEERFTGIETSVIYINKSIDEGVSPSLKTMQESLNGLGKEIASMEGWVSQKEISGLNAKIAGLSASVEAMKSDIEQLENKSDNPLAN